MRDHLGLHAAYYIFCKTLDVYRPTYMYKINVNNYNLFINKREFETIFSLLLTQPFLSPCSNINQERSLSGYVPSYMNIQLQRLPKTQCSLVSVRMCTRSCPRLPFSLAKDRACKYMQSLARSNSGKHRHTFVLGNKIGDFSHKK